MIFIEIISLLIVIAGFMMFGIYGIIGLLSLVIAWQINYRIKTGHWMEGIDH